MFSLDLKGGLPLYEQLYGRISELIMSGTLAEDEKLPTVREVAKDLGINPNTVQKAYRSLEQDNLIYSVPAKGSYIAKRDDAVSIVREKAMSEFGAAAETAVRRGITKQQLHMRIDLIVVKEEEYI
ncbi:MAG: GntR family transcriptional regulator [Eubacterium sp.]|nr:GntR family transcriptional regulator [Eubacterium sp.]